MDVESHSLFREEKEYLTRIEKEFKLFKLNFKRFILN
jgi:hypothetical protein